MKCSSNSNNKRCNFITTCSIKTNSYGMISSLEIKSKSYGLVKKVNFPLTILSTFADETWASVSMKNSSLAEYLPKGVDILAAASSFQSSRKKKLEFNCQFPLHNSANPHSLLDQIRSVRSKRSFYLDVYQL